MRSQREHNCAFDSFFFGLENSCGKAIPTFITEIKKFSMYIPMKRKAREVREKTLSCYHFHLARSISKLSSKLSEDDIFTVCRPERATGNSLHTTDTSAIKESLSMTPNVTINNADNLAARRISRDLLLEPYRASEKAQLVDCIGDWSGAEDQWCSGPINVVGDLDSINLNDFELTLHSSNPTHMKSNDRTKSMHRPDTISPAIFGWNPRCNSWSTVESNDTIESSSSFAQSKRFDSLDDLTTANCVANTKDNTLAPELPGMQLLRKGTGDDVVKAKEELLEDDDRRSFISTSVSTSQQSIWLSDYSESIASLGEDQPFQLIKPTVVLSALLAYRGWQYRATGTSGNVTDKDTSSNAGGAGRGHPDASSCRKRSRDQAGGSEEEQENNNGKKAPDEKKSRTSSRNASGQQVLLACPFAKKDPVTYQSCYKYRLKRIQDVKQHLGRRHKLPIYCPRCMDTFKEESQRDEHIRQSGCPLQDPIAFEGVTRAQRQLLSQRVSGKMSLEAQWFTIFEILFPGHHPRPNSAYINAELSVDLESFRDFMDIHGPGIMLETQRSHGILPPAMESEYVQHAFQQSVTRNGLQIIAQRWLETADLESSVPLADANQEPLFNGHSQPSATSSSTLHEQFCEGDLANQLRAKNVEFGELGQGEDQSFRALLQTPTAFQDMSIETSAVGQTQQDSALNLGESSPEYLYDPGLDNVDSWKADWPQDWFESSNATC